MCGGADGRGPARGGAGRAGSAGRKWAPRRRRPEGLRGACAAAQVSNRRPAGAPALAEAVGACGGLARGAEARPLGAAAGARPGAAGGGAAAAGVGRPSCRPPRLRSAGVRPDGLRAAVPSGPRGSESSARPGAPCGRGAGRKGLPGRRCRPHSRGGGRGRETPPAPRGGVFVPEVGATQRLRSRVLRADSLRQAGPHVALGPRLERDPARRTLRSGARSRAAVSPLRVTGPGCPRVPPG